MEKMCSFFSFYSDLQKTPLKLKCGQKQNAGQLSPGSPDLPPPRRQPTCSCRTRSPSPVAESHGRSIFDIVDELKASEVELTGDREEEIFSGYLTFWSALELTE